MSNEKIKNVVLLIHGVNTRRNKGWLKKFKEYFDTDINFDNTWYADHVYYGYVFFLLTAIPIIKRSKMKEVQRKYREVQKKFPNAKIHIISHSYGTLLTYESIRQSDRDTDKDPIKIGKLITIGGIIEEQEKFVDTLQEGQIEEIHNFCSYKDWVVKLQPLFGKCGYHGFVRSKNDYCHYFRPHANLNIKNYRFNLLHSQYFDDTLPNFYIIWSQLLKRRTKS